MTAGVRLYQIGLAGADANVRYAVTTLRADGRRLFPSWQDAEAAFDDEVRASREDPRVSPYVD